MDPLDIRTPVASDRFPCSMAHKSESPGGTATLPFMPRAKDRKQQEELSAAEKAFHELRFMHTTSKAQPSPLWVPFTIAVAIAAFAAPALVFAFWNSSGDRSAPDLLLGGYISPEEAMAMPPPPDLGPFGGLGEVRTWTSAEADLTGSVVLVHFMNSDSDCHRAEDYLEAVQGLYGDAGVITVVVIDETFWSPNCDFARGAYATSGVAYTTQQVEDEWLVVDRSGNVRFRTTGYPDYRELTRTIATTLVQQ